MHSKCELRESPLTLAERIQNGRRIKRDKINAKKLLIRIRIVSIIVTECAFLNPVFFYYFITCLVVHAVCITYRRFEIKSCKKLTL